MPKIKDTETDKQIHDGRREKLRQRFLRDGLQSFNETEVIEYALGFIINRTDTNPTAHRLINAFGSLSSVIDTHPDKVSAVSGIGPKCAVFLSFLKQFVTYYQNCAKNSRNTIIKTPEDAIGHLSAVMRTHTNEVFVMLALNAKGKIILEQTVSSKAIDRVELDVREIVDTASRVKCVSLIIAHNHLENDPHPSRDDVRLTRSLVNILTPMGIDLIDHIIFCRDGKSFSFCRGRLMDAFKREHTRFSLCDDYTDYIEL
jgi:DNA repair protein RadC